MNFKNYTIERLIGTGGMATVYLAVHNLTGEQIAIKVLNKEFCYNKNIRMRFIDEARKMVQLSHRNIVQFIELLEEDDNVAIVMEYVSGTTLRDILTNKRLNDAEIKRYLTQIISALGYLHQAGFIHRDIKPSNFIINEQGTLKLTDFGISKDTTGKLDEHTQTHTSASMGTPMYMSPEQIRSTKDITYLSDIYSLGVILWEMASGKKPYNTNTLSSFDLQLKIVQEKLPLTGTTWDGLIQKATEKTEEERLQKLEDFLSVEEYIVDDDKTVIHDDRTIIVESPIIGKGHQTPQKQDAKENTNSSSIETKKKKSIGLWIGISVVIIGFIGLMIYFSSGNNNNEKLAATVQPADSTNQNSDTVTESTKAESVKSEKNTALDTINPKTAEKTINNAEPIKYGTVRDIDGNTYKTVKIGKQEWMAENLNVSRFRNGDEIREVQTTEDWIFCDDNGIPAWCYFEYNRSYGKINGKLYNLWAAIDSRGLAPVGWDVPTKDDVIILENHYGGFRKAGKHLKSKDFPGGGGTNISGFNAKCVGERSSSNYEFEVGCSQSLTFWTRTTGRGWGGIERNSISGEIFGIYSQRDWGGHAGAALSSGGFPIRCVKK